MAAEVPCNGCVLCCKGQVVLLRPADTHLTGDEVLTLYDTYEDDAGTALKRQANGDCVYLDGEKCGIYSRRPSVCRKFDCRRIYREFFELDQGERRKRVKWRLVDQQILSRGGELNG